MNWNDSTLGHPRLDQKCNTVLKEEVTIGSKEPSTNSLVS